MYSHEILLEREESVKMATPKSYDTSCWPVASFTNMV